MVRPSWFASTLATIASKVITMSRSSELLKFPKDQLMKTVEVPSLGALTVSLNVRAEPNLSVIDLLVEL